VYKNRKIYQKKYAPSNINFKDKDSEPKRCCSPGTVSTIWPGRGRYDPLITQKINFTIENRVNELRGYLERLKAVSSHTAL
jgi:hypothetical protein